MKKIFAVIGLSVMMAVSFAGCGGGGSDKDESGGVPEFDFGKIEWNVDSGYKNGNEIVKFGYDNNSEYDITSFGIEFKIKDDVTEDEIAEHKELKEKAKDQEEELDELTMDATTTKYVKAGGSFDKGECTLDGTIQLFTDYDAYDLFEPDKMTISYLSGGKIYTAYYNYEKKKTSYDEEVLDAYKWSDSKLAKLLPKPDAKIAIPDMDDKESFTVKIYGINQDFYESYIKECKEKGFNKEEDKNDELWSAKDKEGNNLELVFSKNDDCVSLYLYATDQE